MKKAQYLYAILVTTLLAVMLSGSVTASETDLEKDVISTTSLTEVVGISSFSVKSNLKHHSGYGVLLGCGECDTGYCSPYGGYFTSGGGCECCPIPIALSKNCLGNKQSLLGALSETMIDS